MTYSAFEQRRRMRRIKMIVDLTANLIRSGESLTHREARSLISCARKAVLDLVPSYGSRFDCVILPRLETIMRDRWPLEDTLVAYSEEIVN